MTRLSGQDIGMHPPASRLTIIRALIRRDLLARYGRHSLGFFWAIMEPIILAVGVMLIWSVIHEASMHGVHVTTFVLTCYLPLTLSRHLIGPLSKLGRNSTNLFYHRPLGYADILTARVLVEVMSCTLALTLIYFVTVSIGIVEPVQNWPLALAGWLYTGWFYGGVALLASAWTEFWEPAEKFIQPGQYLAMPLSGTFFLVDWMPAGAQHVLLLNPAVHCYEMFRAGFFGEAVTTHYDVGYLTAWCIALTLAGTAAVYRARDRIQFS
jgi:capsular polysaccharide transport system permease protein